MNFCSLVYLIAAALILIFVGGFIVIDGLGKLVFIMLIVQFFLPQIFGVTDPNTIQSALITSTIIGVLGGLGMVWTACMQVGCGTAGFILTVIIAVGVVIYIDATKIDRAAAMCFGITF